MKKVISLIVVLALITVIVAACGNDGGTPAPAPAPAPAADNQAAGTTDTAEAPAAGEVRETWLVPELTTINLATSLAPNWGHPDEGEYWAWLQDYTNVHVNWTTFLNDEADEQFALLMAARDLPDAFIGQLGAGTDNILTYGVELGVYIPLNDLIQQYAPNFLRRGLAENPDLLNIMTAPDGNIYGLPHISTGNDRIYNMTAINQTWLDTLGLDVPTTIDEVEEVLIAFRDGDPNGDGSTVVPLTFMFDCWGAADHGPWFGPFGAPLSHDLILIVNNTVTFQGAEDYFRDGARWLASLYAQGLLDREVFTYDEPSYRARAGATPPVFGIWSSWSPHEDSGANNDHYTTLLGPITGPGGANQIWEQIVGFNRETFIITSAAPDPALLMRWVDVFYKDLYTALNSSMGQGPDENKAWFINAEDQIEWVNPRPDEYIRGMQELPFSPMILGAEMRAREVPPTGLGLQRMTHQNGVLRAAAENFFNGTWNRWPGPAFMLPEEADEISFIEADLVPFANRMLASWIAGERNVDADWEQYLQDLDSYGLQRWLELRQGIWNRISG
jgi:putative aldouronate transport system substrate-binding protein